MWSRDPLWGSRGGNVVCVYSAYWKAANVFVMRAWGSMQAWCNNRKSLIMGYNVRGGT